MEQFLSAQARDNDWESLTRECLRQLAPWPADTRLGFIYITDYLAPKLSSIIYLLKRETGIDHWVGTVGMGICAGNQEIYGTPAMCIMIAPITDDAHVIFSSQETRLPGFVEQHRDWLESNRRHFGVLHGDPRSVDTSITINQMTSYIPNSYFVGGLSSSQTSFPQVARAVVDHGVSGVIFNERVPVLTSLTQGCTPIGPVHTITQCDRNFIFEIDHQPALQIFKQDIGEILARNLQKVSGYIFAALPLGQGGTHNYKVRTLMGIDLNRNAIVIGDLVTEGQSIQFTKRDSQSAWQDHVDTLEKLKQRVHGPIKGALYVSCLGRGRNLFGPDSQELALIQQHFGTIPLVGFFANGEIAHNELYGFTGVLTLFV